VHSLSNDAFACRGFESRLLRHFPLWFICIGASSGAVSSLNCFAALRHHAAMRPCGHAAMRARRAFKSAVTLWLDRNAFKACRRARLLHAVFAGAARDHSHHRRRHRVWRASGERGDLGSNRRSRDEQAAAAVEEAVRRSQLKESGILPTLLGFGALAFGATTVFAQMQRSLNQFWAWSPSRPESGASKGRRSGQSAREGFLVTKLVTAMGLQGIVGDQMVFRIRKLLIRQMV
jgi:hypothetical protein